MTPVTKDTKRQLDKQNKLQTSVHRVYFCVVMSGCYNILRREKGSTHPVQTSSNTVIVFVYSREDYGYCIRYAFVDIDGCFISVVFVSHHLYRKVHW